MSLLEVRDLSVAFPGVQAVKGISFDVPVRGSVALVGESGSGKSVTALSIMGLLPKESATVRGQVLYRGQPGQAARVRGSEIAMIFQEPMSSLNPVFPVAFQIGEVLSKHLGLLGRALRERIAALLEEVGLPAARADAYPFQLSGGQQQRVMIAMAIACEPKLLIADEPTTALDVTVQRQILDLIAGLRSRHEMAMLFITHDLGLVSEIADQVIVMRDGEIREQGATAQIFATPKDAYTRALLACRPPIGRRPSRLPVIDDFLGGGGPPSGERSRGLRGDEPTVLEARGLAKSFYLREGLLRKRELPAVKGASFRIAKGRTLGVVGESGSGKTTLAWLLTRLHPASAGEVRFDGADLLKVDARSAMPYKRRIQIVFQNPYASLNPRFTIGQILAEPMLIHGIGADGAERRSRALNLLAKVGLPAQALDKYPHEFSGGQRQRIAIARALTLTPELLILDESVSALDVSVQAQLLNLLQDLQDEYGMSYLFISHDLAVVRYMSDEVIVMKDGEIVEAGAADELFARPRHPYTQTLLASIPGRAQ
ncbi:MAG TPA: ABC transporter ATP-binding protein [Burkholderiales bacterium]|jgi:peptide/nickel transport system ATP-binding protein|nr:ABC transporter ATP-binding protein [Burkholderiales bacterium]